MKKHPKRVEQITPYILDIATRMNLKDWDIHIGPEACGEQAHATASFTDGKRNVWVRLEKNFQKRTPEELRYTIAHELVHPHFAGLHIPLSNGLGPVAAAFVLNELEMGVDEMAKLLAPSMPLPPKIG